MKDQLDVLKRLEEDCKSIQHSMAIIQSAQRILTYYTSAERQKLFKEYAALTTDRRAFRGSVNSSSALAVFREDHSDLCLIADALAQGTPVDLSKLKLNF